ncbi:MAG: 6-carboxytetrahydropterin synthase [Candidatus Marinimicrobia bacterium]|nr:6-carboxytetrahydropterin synthase [Candidatus Neomarinimicrobiota bacterium]MBL7023442.1 6-carboxytetrahydropterin synthase [Candidatus Neomarinimicrobiota bacterium]MBL7108809.1 6-carboxytetrahydropterin synthase [Candidatus Neomarinimicrobiota bacterium]
MKIVKIIQWDMGHRVMNHRSACKGLHGHRYKAEICVEGDIVTKSGASEEGMVIDFGDVKNIALDFINNKLDHGFMVWDKDSELIDFFNNTTGHKPIIVPFTPTAENIAKFIFETLDKKFEDKYSTGLKLCSVKLWETPTSYAVYEK